MTISIVSEIVSACDRIGSSITQRGFTMVNGIPLNGMTVMHTIGLTNKGWPEIVITGAINSMMMTNLVLALVHVWRESDNAQLGLIPNFFFVPSQVDGEVSSYPIKTVTISSEESGLINCPYMRQFYPESNFKAVQLLWPDCNGVFPDDPLYSSHIDVFQPCFQVLQ